MQGARTAADISAGVAADAKAARDNTSGVNLDEEAARLIQYQQSYQAAAKILQVAQTVFDALLDAGPPQRTTHDESPPPKPSTPASTRCSDASANLVDAQQQLTSGKRVERASDDPTAAARAERALSAIGRADASQRALEASRNAMSMTEARSAMRANCCSRRARRWSRPATPATATPSGARSPTSCAACARNCSAVANRGDGAGGFLFARAGRRRAAVRRCTPAASRSSACPAPARSLPASRCR